MKITQDLSKFSFGATSAVTSSIALLAGLNQMGASSLSIVGALLVVGFADNIADSLGMHIYSESKTKGHPKLNTIANYITRAAITTVPIMLVLALPLQDAILASVVFGFFVLAALSYLIAKVHGVNPFRAAAEHLFVAILVLVSSQFIGAMIRSAFGNA